MKFINIILSFVGALGIIFCVWVSFGNQNAPLTQMIALCTFFSTSFIAGFLGEQIRRK